MGPSGSGKSSLLALTWAAGIALLALSGWFIPHHRGGTGRCLALAGLVLRDTPVVLLDEPFSALDRATEQHVLAGLSPWLQRRRAVIVTHAPERLPPTWPRLGLSSPP